MIGLVAILISGCSQSEEQAGVTSHDSVEERIVAAYQSAATGNDAYMLYADEKETKKAIQKDGLGYCSGLPTAEKVKSRASCELSVEKIGESGVYAKVQRVCENSSENGPGFVKEEGGVWKTLVLQ